MKLTLSLSGHGQHPAAWRVSALARGPGQVPRYEGVVRAAEQAELDAVLFVPPAGGPDRLLAGDGDAIQIDTMPLIASLIARTDRIGLGATVYMAHTQPFHTARAFAVMDNLSAGRTAWLVDAEGADQQEADFGHAGHPGRAARYARAAEYIEVACKLWDSWEDGAVVADKEAGLFADSTRIHPIHHAGPHFQVRGPLTAVRPIQGHPVIVMRDASPEGLALAARFAHLFLTDDAATVRPLRTAATGREPASLRILLNMAVVLAPTAEAAEARAERLDAQLDAMRDPGPLPGPAQRFVGTPQGLADRLVALKEAAGCDGFNILPAVLPDDATAFGTAVVPLLQQRGCRPPQLPGSTLREHLGLPRPVSVFAAAAG
jgi:alkanesulfonate monooxygenase SsuD/methylene tetrahydromethanopterin reductase-like flavin-dependent oxidoreductase (luciferase family)